MVFPSNFISLPFRSIFKNFFCQFSNNSLFRNIFSNLTSFFCNFPTAFQIFLIIFEFFQTFYIFNDFTPNFLVWFAFSFNFGILTGFSHIFRISSLIFNFQRYFPTFKNIPPILYFIPLFSLFFKFDDLTNS